MRPVFWCSLLGQWTSMSKPDFSGVQLTKLVRLLLLGNDDVHFPRISVSTSLSNLVLHWVLYVWALTSICNALADSCKALTCYRQYVCWKNIRPTWVWGVGNQWAGIGARGRVILESVIFLYLLSLSLALEICTELKASNLQPPTTKKTKWLF